MRERVLLYCPESKSCNQRKEKKKMDMNHFEDVLFALEDVINSRKIKENLSFFENFDMNAFTLAQDDTEEVYDTFVDVNERA